MTIQVSKSDNNSYNDIPQLEDVVKIRKDTSPISPSKKVFDVSLPDSGLNKYNEPEL